MSSCYNIYSNENVTNTLTSMIISERLSHAFLLYGEKGLGKKTLACHIAAQILCEKGNGSICGECKSCKMIAHESHPDVIWVKHSGAKQGFSVKDLRDVVVEAVVMPNDGRYKIYILSDCDMISAAAQNTLLKVIEEPPSHAIFIFTASSKAVFLPTIISRVIPLGVSEVSHKICKQALIKSGITDDIMLEKAISAFGGNIGMCKEFIESDELPRAVEISKNITDKLVTGSEYELLKAFFPLDGNKPLTKIVISLLCGIIRDSSTMRLESNSFIGCYKQGSQGLARAITLKQASDIFQILNITSQRIDGNANLGISLTSLCGNIKNAL